MSANLDKLYARALAASLDFPAANKIADDLYEEVKRKGDVMQKFPKGPTGLVSDAIRVSPEYRKANAEYEAAFQKSREFNGVFTKRFAKELRQLREEKRRNRTVK